MKKTILFMTMFLGVLVSAFAQEVKQDGAHIEFLKEVHDYGVLEYGADSQTTFEFKNTGNAPLIISDAKKTCGCTVPSWPKEPIAPGATGTITVRYDTKRPGVINKSVTIMSNAVNAPTAVIRIKGEVKPKPTSGIPENKTGVEAK